MNPTDRPLPIRRSARKHRAILDAAAACVARDGFAATTVEAVAAEAGVGKQTIYRWWPSKTALYVEVYSDLVARDALATGDGPAQARLAAMLRRLFRLYQETPAGQILAGLIAAATADEQARAALAEGLVLGRADLVGEIVAAGAAGCSPEVANEVVVAIVWKRLVAAPDTLTAAFADRLAALALAAAACDPAAPSSAAS